MGEAPEVRGVYNMFNAKNSLNLLYFNAKHRLNLFLRARVV